MCGTIMGICIYIYVCVCVCVCVCVYMCVLGWVAKEGILSSASLTSVRLSVGFPLSVYFGAKTTQSAVPA